MEDPNRATRRRSRRMRAGVAQCLRDRRAALVVEKDLDVAIRLETQRQAHTSGRHSDTPVAVVPGVAIDERPIVEHDGICRWTTAGATPPVARCESRSHGLYGATRNG
jgi:hypothetical protein